VSHQVYQVRKGLGAPHPFPPPASGMLRDLEWLKQNAARLKGMTFGKVFAMLAKNKAAYPVCLLYGMETSS